MLATCAAVYKIADLSLQLTDGSSIELSRRERPELIHEKGRLIALISGAQFGAVPGNPGDQTFTLVQEVRARDN